MEFPAEVNLMRMVERCNGVIYLTPLLICLEFEICVVKFQFLIK